MHFCLEWKSRCDNDQFTNKHGNPYVIFSATTSFKNILLHMTDDFFLAEYEWDTFAARSF
jgi:hypothetical protein